MTAILDEGIKADEDNCSSVRTGFDSNFNKEKPEKAATERTGGEPRLNLEKKNCLPSECRHQSCEENVYSEFCSKHGKLLSSLVDAGHLQEKKQSSFTEIGFRSADLLSGRSLAKRIVDKIGREFFDKQCFERTVSRLPTQGLTPEEAVKTVFGFEGIGFYRNINPMQHPYELKKLAEIAKDSDPDVVVEIGTARGGNFYVLTQVTDADLYISIDLPDGEFGGGYPSERKKLYKSFTDAAVELVRADSHKDSTKHKLQEILEEYGKESVDFLFIDGDHTYEGVKQDFKLYQELVSEGSGVICFHDIVHHPNLENCNVDRFWTEIKTGYDTVEFKVNPEKQEWGGIGVIEK
jgi:cephalosporin hydroxylase